MPDVKSTHLRIYCVCGQKMKVLEKMYGLPGKCIACRQKIRIPKRNQVPEGATEVHLKDHPEFLRGSRRRADEAVKEKAAQKALDAAKARPETSGDSTPNTELDLVDGTPQKPAAAATLPIDTLDALQRLCSLQHKLEHQLSTLDEYHHDDQALLAEVEGLLTRVRKLRIGLDEELHQLLMEVAIELTSTQEKIAQDRLSARVGEISFDEYQERIYRLRARRERLERRQQNLRGWLAARDPYVAGGFLDISTRSVPEEGFRLALPIENDEGRPLLSQHIASLSEALNRRVRAKQKLEQAERLAFDAGDEEGLDAAQLECETERRMARAAARFFLDRLERLKKDFTADIETVDAQMEAVRDRLKADEITRQQYDETERSLLHAKKDLAKARSMASRALAANTLTDLPRPGGTFLQRLGFASDKPATPAMWLGLALLAIWTAGICTMAYNLYQAFDGLEPMASFNAWLHRPGVWLMAAALAGIAGASLAALWPFPKLRPLALAVIVTGVVAAGLIPSGAAGVFAPPPDVNIVIEGTLQGPRQAGYVHVTNPGRRPLRFMIEKRVGGNSWSGISPGPPAGDGPERSELLRTIDRGETRTIPFSLKPGDYRVLLLTGVADTKLVRQFTIEESEPREVAPQIPPAPVEVPSVPSAVPASTDEVQPEPDPQPAPLASAPSGLKVELKGVMSGPNGAARFSFILHLPNGRERSLMLNLGERLWEDWDVSEFNPSFSTVTLQRGESLLILRRGDQIDLPL